MNDISANGTRLFCRCRCRCGRGMFRFIRFITTFTLVIMVRFIIRPFFRVFVGKCFDRLGFGYFFAYRTKISRFSLFGASRRFRFRSIIPSMYTCCRQFFVCRIVATISFASYILIPTNFGTRRGLCFMCFLIVFKGRYVFRRGRSFANRTGKRFYARFCTGWLFGYLSIIPSMITRCREFYACRIFAIAGISSV